MSKNDESQTPLTDAASDSIRGFIWVTGNGVFLVAFILSVLVQWNDPDPFAWMAIYSLAAMSCVCAFAKFRGRISIYLAVISALIAWAWIFTLLPQMQTVAWREIVESLQMKSDAVEVARELGGLLLVALWMSFLV